jgi:hypothetical protein
LGRTNHLPLRFAWVLLLGKEEKGLNSLRFEVKSKRDTTAAKFSSFPKSLSGPDGRSTPRLRGEVVGISFYSSFRRSGYYCTDFG